MIGSRVTITKPGTYQWRKGTITATFEHMVFITFDDRIFVRGEIVHGIWCVYGEYADT